jgi:hypothetical protein
MSGVDIAYGEAVHSIYRFQRLYVLEAHAAVFASSVAAVPGHTAKEAPARNGKIKYLLMSVIIIVRNSIFMPKHKY